MSRFFNVLSLFMVCSILAPVRLFCEEGDLAKSFDFSVHKEGSGVIRVNIHPAHYLPGRIYSMTLIPAEDKVSFPLPKHTPDKDKAASILVALEETFDGALTTPFYKKGARPAKKFLNPFASPPVTDLEGNAVGSQARGILFVMSHHVGPGVVMTPKGTGQIPWKPEEGFTFLLHLKPSPKMWKILLGIVHVDLLDPHLQDPVLSPSFNSN